MTLKPEQGDTRLIIDTCKKRGLYDFLFGINNPLLPIPSFRCAGSIALYN